MQITANETEKSKYRIILRKPAVTTKPTFNTKTNIWQQWQMRTTQGVDRSGDATFLESVYQTNKSYNRWQTATKHHQVPRTLSQPVLKKNKMCDLLLFLMNPLKNVKCDYYLQYTVTETQQIGRTKLFVKKNKTS